MLASQTTAHSRGREPHKCPCYRHNPYIKSRQSTHPVRCHLLHPNMPADQTTAHSKASACAASHSPPSQGNHILSATPAAASQHNRHQRTKTRGRLKADACAATRRIHVKTKNSSSVILHPLHLNMPADHGTATAYGKTSAQAASRSTRSSRQKEHIQCATASQHASRL